MTPAPDPAPGPPPHPTPTRPLEMAAVALAVASTVALLVVEDDLLRLAGRAGATSSAAGVLVGWAPLGGLATWVGLLALRRAARLDRGRSVTRFVDRAATAVACAWIGLPVSLLPSRLVRDDGAERIRAVAGADVLHGLQWSVIGVGIALLVAVVAAAVLFRDATREALPPVPARLRLLGGTLVTTYVGVLVGLLLAA